MSKLEPFLFDPDSPYRSRRPLVRVVHIENPSSFYVQMYRVKPFNEYYNMGQYCGDLLNNDNLEAGDKVLLETSDGWRRNVVAGLDESNIELKDLDFGLTRKVEKTGKIYSINGGDTGIEPQAIHCKLYWARPISNTGWTESNTNSMKNFLKDFKFVSEMELLQYQNEVLEVDLWNGHVDGISRRLIYVNQARFRN